MLPFQFGMRQRCNSVESFPIDLFGQQGLELVTDILVVGQSILTYQRQQDEALCKRISFPVTWKGYRCVCINAGGVNSRTFTSIYDPLKYDIMMSFVFNGKHWTVTLYTTHDSVDCSVLAKEMGGGGHKKASGFQTGDIQTIIGDGKE